MVISSKDDMKLLIMKVFKIGLRQGWLFTELPDWWESAQTYFWAFVCNSW